MSFINFLLFVKKISCKRRLLFNLFIVTIFCFYLSSCDLPTKKTTPSEKYELTQEDRLWLREFFHDILFEDPGAYVLYGTKPMSWTILKEKQTSNEEIDLDKWYKNLSDKEKTKYSIREQDSYDTLANFKKWQKIKSRFPITQYLFATFPSRFDPKGPDSLFFVNIEMTLRMLINHYSEFRQFVGEDFDPLQIVFDLENRDSKFWNKVLNNDFLIGILLGFGKDNSYFFECEKLHGKSDNKIGSFIRGLPCKTYENRDIVSPNPANFLLPIFGSYGLYPNDKNLIKTYVNEREFIKKLYHENDEVEIALSWLTR